RSLHTRNPFNPKVICDLAALLKEEKIYVLCTHEYKSNIIGRLSSWIAGIPEIAVSRGWTGESRKVRLYEGLDKLFLKAADHVVAVSGGQRDRVVRLGIRPAGVSVIYNGVDIGENGGSAGGRVSGIRGALGIHDNACFVVSAGRLSPEKNFGGLIEAAKIVAGKRRDIRFAVFGEGEERGKLERKILNAGLQEVFSLPGFRRDFLTALREADMFVLPSFTEGMPNVVLEACSLKKPVVATAVGGVPEIIRDGHSGFLVRPEETAKMADYIMMLADNMTLREEMGNRGYEYLKERFDFDIQTRKYEELYAWLYDSFHHRRHARKK
ncbi:MAG TPA: glycosyltransferase, partial [Dissulfurispiraceae bacterium]